MADLYRVGRALLALLLLTAMTLAEASYPSTPGTVTWEYSATVNTASNPGQCFSTLPTWMSSGQSVANTIAGCQAASCAKNSSPNPCPYSYTGVFTPPSGSVSPTNAGTIKVTNTFAPGNITYNNPATARMAQLPNTCSDPNSSLDPGGATCTCHAPQYTDNATNNGCMLSPEAQTCTLAAQTGVEEWMTVKGAPGVGTTSCSASGCAVKWQSTVTYTDKTSGEVTTEGNTKFTGQTCTGSPETSASKDTCPGGSLGTVNGVSTCVNFDPDTNVIKSTSAGTTTTSITPSTPGGTGTGVTTVNTGTTTVCNAGACNTTTTTTTTNPDGTTKTESETTSEPQADYCNDRPKDPACMDSTFAGSCSGNYSCTGDAVMCAAATAINRLRCDLVEKDSPEKAVYESAKNEGTSTLALTASTVALSQANFDQSNALGVGAQCIADLNVTVWGRAVTLPFSTVCPSLAIAGNLMLAISFLLAIRIVGRG